MRSKKISHSDSDSFLRGLNFDLYRNLEMVNHECRTLRYLPVLEYLKCSLHSYPKTQVITLTILVESSRDKSSEFILALVPLYILTAQLEPAS